MTRWAGTEKDRAEDVLADAYDTILPEKKNRK